MAPTRDDEDRPTTELASDERPTTAMRSGAPAAPEAPEDLEAAAIAAPPKKSRILTYLVTLLVVSVLGPLVFYFGFWRFQPTAQFHIPSGTTIAVRLDTRELYVFRPFRERIIPLLAPPSTDSTKPTKLDQIRSETGIDLGNDLREVVAATSDGRAWVILGGGRFLGGARRGPFVDGFAHAMEKEPALGAWSPQGNVVAGPAGVAVAQAEDGTLIAANSVDLAKAALPATDDYRELWLASSGAISFAIQRGALEHFAAAQRGVMPEAALFDKLERVTGWVTLGEKESRVTMELLVSSDQPIEIVSAQAQAFVDAASKRVEGDADLGLARPLFATAKLQTRATTIMVTGTMTGAETTAVLDRLAGLLGEARPLH